MYIVHTPKGCERAMSRRKLQTTANTFSVNIVDLPVPGRVSLRDEDRAVPDFVFLRQSLGTL